MKLHGFSFSKRRVYNPRPKEIDQGRVKSKDPIKHMDTVVYKPSFFRRSTCASTEGSCFSNLCCWFVVSGCLKNYRHLLFTLRKKKSMHLINWHRYFSKLHFLKCFPFFFKCKFRMHCSRIIFTDILVSMLQNIPACFKDNMIEGCWKCQEQIRGPNSKAVG